MVVRCFSRAAGSSCTGASASNELDAIAICKAFVTAQFEYAYRPHKGYSVPQYAQRILSTTGKQDGLAWKNSDGSWGGPIGPEVAHAIEQGYNLKAEPYHGYFFKVLHGQGPAAPLGAMELRRQGCNDWWLCARRGTG